MVSDLRINGDPVDTVFDLLGQKENDITYALGWGLAQVPTFLGVFMDLCGASSGEVESAQIDLQLHGAHTGHSGITDIEVRTRHTLTIVEAKRGWDLPSFDQLHKYTSRLSAATQSDARLVVLTQWGETEYVRSQLGAEIDGWPIATVGLGAVALAAERASRKERRPRTRDLLVDLARYLFSVAEMTNRHDNQVYVVSLSNAMSEAGVSFIDVVEKLGVYWYPAAGRGGWPKTPPNYVGFRYRGELQRLHYVESSKLVANIADEVPEVKAPPRWGPAFVLRLGPPIPIPPGIRTGSGIQRSARRTVDIDLLLTSATISEAAARTVERHVPAATEK